MGIALDLNEAIPLYLGKGVVPFPLPDRTRLVERYGEPRSLQLETQIKRLLVELDAIPIAKDAASLSAFTDAAIAEFRKDHPLLSNLALDALAWNYSDQWR